MARLRRPLSNRRHPRDQSHLTIEPGARLEFREAFGINVNENGSLTPDAATANRLHDNAAGIVQEQ